MTFKKTAETLPKGAHTLERDYYVNPSILQREYNNIFFKNWICAGRSSELTEVGQYKLINIDTESVIVLREKNGDLKALYKEKCCDFRAAGAKNFGVVGAYTGGNTVILRAAGAKILWV